MHINNFNGSWMFYLIVREIVLARKFFTPKGKSNRTIVKKGIALTMNIIIGEHSWYG
jgi:DNA-binding winged helix-turn-helix (wHTH) protein